jgi:O-antigen ligase
MFTFPALNRANIWYVLVILTAISFTWSERLNSIGIILLVVHWTLDRKLIDKCLLLISSKTSAYQLSSRLSNMQRISIYLLISFFLIHLIALIWSDYKIQGWQTIEVKLSFFILPLLFSTEHYLDKKKTELLLFIFSISCCLSFCYACIYSYLHYIDKGWILVLNRMSISEGIMHPGYYSNYFAFALVFCIFQWLDIKNKISLKSIAFIGLILFLSTAILMLISKTTILFLGCFGLFLLWLATSRIKNILTRILVFILSLFITILLAIQIPNIKYRINETFNDTAVIDTNVILENSTGSRIAAWTTEWHLIKQNWLIGYGTGEANPQLKKQFIKEGYHNLANENMHTHNQILHTWLDLGIVGVVLLFLILFVSGYLLFTNKRPLGYWLVLLILFNISTDDMLEVQAGTVFFIFFLTLFLYQKEENRYGIKYSS